MDAKSEKVKGFNLTIKPAYKKQEVESLTTDTDTGLPF